MEEEEYSDIGEEYLIEALSQASQTLPPLSRSRHRAKRRRTSHDDSSNTTPRPGSRRSTRSLVSEGEDIGSDEDEKPKKKKYKIHIGHEEVPPARILGATQAEALPDSSPYRIRGPIYKKLRPEPPRPEPQQPPLPKPPIFSRLQKPDSPRRIAHAERPPAPWEDEDLARELADLPSDSFLSSPEVGEASRQPIAIGSSAPQQSTQVRQRLVAVQQGLRQTTLFGGRAAEEVTASQAKKVHNYIVDKGVEVPTHHVLDHEALKTWVYPTNLGATRDYQFSIVKNGLFNNLLVALPTGLGKTFIAATIMLNFFRWTKSAQIIFVAPTKPLVAQQVEACFSIVGIPRSATTMLTGEQAPVLRAEEWKEKRVFFMTPQTLENDLSSGIADPKKIVLLVVDEAHRATGNYAYIKVVQFLRRFNKSFRVLALTATPGASVEAVQEVIDGLEISRVEIRTEESIDIQQFVHRRNIDTILLDPSEEMVRIKELFSKALQPLVNQLCAQNAYWNKDPMSLTAYGLITARKQWFASDAGRRANQGVKGMMMGLFSILASIAHGIKLLTMHGIGPFYSVVKDFRSTVEDGNKGGKYRKQVVSSPEFVKMMNLIQVWISNDNFVGHPKLTYLCDTVLNHFLDAGEGRLGEDTPPSSTRVIVFAEYRESAEDITRVLNRHGPLVRASVFVGQADSKRSEGMNQAKQLETIRNFKEGTVNVIVATSIGEEGLDIGQVDLIVCYDASASPIRMLQRMGRTGRKRAGKIVLLLMRGKEEESFTKAKDNYEQMQKMISAGTRFNFRHDLSARILPRDITPVVDKRIIEIPPENTQDTSLPEPKRRRAKGLKKPAKKFHMPDGVETGFMKASRLDEDGNLVSTAAPSVKKLLEMKAAEQLVEIPSRESVFLSTAETVELGRRFQQVAGNDLQEVSIPDLTAQPEFQRALRPTGHVKHGQYTRRCVRLFKTLADSQDPEARYFRPYGDEELSGQSWDTPCLADSEDETSVTPVPTKKPRARKAKPPKKAALVLSDLNDDDDETDDLPTQQLTSSRTAIPSSEGPGEDIMDSSQSSQGSGSDDDDLESLADFIVDEDAARSFSPRKRRISTIRSSTTPPATEPERPLKKLFYEPTQFTATQDTNDDEMPDVGDIVGLNSRVSKTLDLGDVESEDDEVEPAELKRRNRSRAVVEDDSDE